MCHNLQVRSSHLGASPLHFAVEADDMEMMTILVDAGVEVPPTPNAPTTLQMPIKQF